MTVFQPWEIEKLSERFKHVKAPLQFDYQQFELEAMEDLGILKNHPHIYLGEL